MKNYEDLGIQIPEILLPVEGIDLQKWSVIACDQYTSQPDYWKDVENFVGESPSTLNLVLPEVYLEQDDEVLRIEKTKNMMENYLQNEVFWTYEGLILVERCVAGKTRYGLMLALDLEKYDFSKGSQSLIRATEGTIIERLPPRIRIREGAKIEFPHILVLIDDPNKTVIEPLVTQRPLLQKLYDFELMKNSGHLCGYAINQEEKLNNIINSLKNFADPDHFKNHYGIDDNFGVLLFAMGDGNHSLATAKSIWERLKPEVGLNHPARFALVEVENIHDSGLDFEPIHRVLFNINEKITNKISLFWNNQVKIQNYANAQQMIQEVDQQSGQVHKFGLIYDFTYSVVEVQNPSANLPVGTLQSFLDSIISDGCAERIDYIHGAEITCILGSKPGNCSFYLPAMQKNQLFKTVILDGALPRKTFSMGEAYEKRFYLEGRKITE
ncbi:MAG: DUF1015 domain-containing protein [Anaerolineaceae bacterium]|nr:DUF1015 domain-containing protein [Anaerolineaceae bacterium]